MHLYFGNLPLQMTGAQLRDLILPFGEPDAVRVGVTTHAGIAHAFGYAELANDIDARAALAALRGHDVCGRSIVVSDAPLPLPR